MIQIADLYTIIEKQKTPHILVVDSSNIKVFEVNAVSPKGAIDELREMENQFRQGFGKLTFKCATPGQKQAGYKGACVWHVGFGTVTDNTGKVTQPVGAFSQMKDMLECMQLMKTMQQPEIPIGYVHPEVAKAQAELEKKKAELELEKYKLLVNNDDPVKKYGSLAPIFLSALGKTPAEIKEMISMSAMMHNAQNGMNRAAGTVLSTDNITGEFKDLQNVTVEDKNARIEKAMQKLAETVSAEEMVILTESLAKNPQLASQAVLMIQNAAGSTEEKTN
jgi:hypothetical protein